MGQSQHPAYRPDIDGLRAIAVLSVVAFHASNRLVPGGFVGVDVFFVISGYLISGNIFKGLEVGAFSVVDFYGRRVRRIFPALLVVLLTSWMIGWFFYLPEDYKHLGKHIAAGAGFISNFALWKESGYFDPAAQQQPLLHLWSLGIEEQFYIAWPLAVIVAWRRIPNLIWLMVSVLAASFALNLWWIREPTGAAFYFPLSRFWELLAGGCLAYIAVRNGRAVALDGGRGTGFPVCSAPLRDAAAATGLLFLLVSIFALDKDQPYPGWWAAVPTAGSFLLIAAGENAWINRRILSTRLMVAIGLISYPLYLWHWPLLYFARDLLQDEISHRPLTILAVGVAMLLSVATYHYVEKPVRKPNSTHKAQAAVLATVLMVVMGIAGFLTYRQDGFATRFPESARELLNLKYDYDQAFRTGKCMLGAQEKEDFSSDCVETENLKKRYPVVLLWGDSHAAQFYQALMEWHDKREFALAQFTSSSCPPILNFDKFKRPFCRQLNDTVRERILQLRPTTVILAHDWPQSVDENALGGLGETTRFLKQSGVENIVLLGPVPHWNKSLPKALMGYMRDQGFTSVPGRMRYGLVKSVEKLDLEMEKLAASLKVSYIPPHRILCNSDGCLTTVGAEEKRLIAFDNAHFTPDGARFFIDQIADKIFVATAISPASRHPQPAETAAQSAARRVRLIQ